ncbi:hypothetical protein M758_8G077100 [Ceratodon purpureus]|nr:hypothetical protein M758_8G077100 [Ceratodon purpureus]
MPQFNIRGKVKIGPSLVWSFSHLPGEVAPIHGVFGLMEVLGLVEECLILLGGGFNSSLAAEGSVIDAALGFVLSIWVEIGIGIGIGILELDLGFNCSVLEL